MPKKLKHSPRFRVLAVMLSVFLLTGVLLLAAGCGKSQSAQQAQGPKKIKIGYAGGACEAFIYSAYEKGFFKEEGLEVELVKVDFETLKEALTTGKIEAANGMVMKWVKPFEQGVNASFTAGIHTGCIQTLVPTGSDIKTVADLKGKTIGNNGMGDGPMVFTMRALAKANVDPKKDVQWRAFPATELEGALDRGEVAAITLSDPISQLIVEKGKARKLINTADDQPYSQEYCCMATISGKFLKEDPAGAAAVTRALMKGAKWVAANQDEAAKLMVEKKYVPGNVELIAKLLKSYNYIPSVDGGEKAVDLAITEMKSIGVLEPTTSEAVLKRRVFVRLEGVN
ncbi:MAG: ABC transporter substrate-binding protein [Negativicutes bacterium]|nr:ABC transporter substrate-binding protein [Negativicutes bacterium]